MKNLRPEVLADYKSSGGLMELFDNQLILLLNITLEELDFISEKSSDEELGCIVSKSKTFSEKRRMLEIRNNYLKLLNESK